MKTTGRRRGLKSWFVEPYRQVKLGLLFLIINTLFAAIILSVFGYYIWDMYRSILTYFELSGAHAAHVESKFYIPAIVGGVVIVLFVFTTLLVSVKYTHQIYGPLVSIHRYLDGLTKGQTPEPLQLRESDQLKELANKLNSIGERLSDGKRQAPMIAIYRFLDDLLDGKNPGEIRLRDGDHLQELVDKLNLLAKRVQKEDVTS